MTFTLKEIRDAIAGVLLSQYPQYPVFGSPTQQGAKPPCFFVFFIPDSKMVDQVGGAAIRELGVDIVFVQERNTLNAYQLAEEIADYLDDVLDPIPFGETSINARDQKWNIDDELHYKFYIKERVRWPQTDPEMTEIESYQGGIK